MAFMDILGGLAGGLSQGLGQVQQNVEARRRSTEAEREMLLKQLMAARQQEELARQQALTPITALEDGVEFDPNDPTYAPGVKLTGPSAFVKGTTPGKLMKRRKASDVKADKELAEWDKGAPEREATRALIARTQAMQQSAFNLFEQKYGPQWVENIRDMDQKDRMVAGMMLMKDKDAFLRPEEAPGVLAAGISAAGSRDTAKIYASAQGAGRGMTPDQLLDNYRAYISAKGGPGTQARNELRDKFGNDQIAHMKAWATAMGLMPGSNIPFTVNSIREVK